MSQKIAALIKSRRRGAAIVEFSLAFMLFLVIMVTLMEFGRAMWTYTTICHAARQGARFAMTRGSLNPTTKTDVENVIKKAASGLEDSKITLKTEPTDLSAVSRGSTLELEVLYDFELVTGNLLLGYTTIPMASRSSVIVAN